MNWQPHRLRLRATTAAAPSQGSRSSATCEALVKVTGCGTIEEADEVKTTILEYDNKIYRSFGLYTDNSKFINDLSTFERIIFKVTAISGTIFSWSLITLLDLLSLG